jgi:hypothetical protein
MPGILFAKLVALGTVAVAFAGCVEMEEGYDAYSRSYSSHRTSQQPEQDCHVPAANAPARDPLHIQESRDVHGYSSNEWQWMLAACHILHYNVTVRVAGTTDHFDAVATTFHVELQDPKRHTIVEDQETALLSESRTLLNWTLKPGAEVEPGEWSLRLTATGDLQYDVEVYLEY